MKKYLLGLFAIALAIGFSAFTSQQNAKTTQYYFDYDPGQSQYVSVTAPSGMIPSVLLSDPNGCSKDIDICTGVFDNVTEVPLGGGNSRYEPAGSHLFDTYENDL